MLRSALYTGIGFILTLVLVGQAGLTPEPTTMLVMGIGLFCLVGLIRGGPGSKPKRTPKKILPKK